MPSFPLNLFLNHSVTGVTFFASKTQHSVKKIPWNIYKIFVLVFGNNFLTCFFFIHYFFPLIFWTWHQCCELGLLNSQSGSTIHHPDIKVSNRYRNNFILTLPRDTLWKLMIKSALKNNKYFSAVSRIWMLIVDCDPDPDNSKTTIRIQRPNKSQSGSESATLNATLLLLSVSVFLSYCQCFCLSPSFLIWLCCYGQFVLVYLGGSSINFNLYSYQLNA